MTNIELSEVIGKNITALREAAEMPIEFLAEKLEISLELMRSIEQGEVVIDLPNLIKVSSLFGVDITYLLSKNMECAIFSKNTYERLSLILQSMDKENLDLVLKFAMFIRRLKEDRDLSGMFRIL